MVSGPQGPQGSGSARISITSNGRLETVVLKEVLFVPRPRCNLRSVSNLTDDFHIKATRKTMILKKGKSSVHAVRHSGFYLLNAVNIAQENEAESSQPNKKSVSSTEAHRTIVHINTARLKTMLENKGYEVIPDFVECKSSIIENKCIARASGSSRRIHLPLV